MIKKTIQKRLRDLSWCVCVIALFSLGSGCKQIDLTDNDLTAPASRYVDSSSNFVAYEYPSSRFAWNEGSGVLCVDIPKAGDYLLTYMTKAPQEHQQLTNTPSDPFTIVFRASAPAQLRVNYSSGEILSAFTLQQGSVKGHAIGLYDDGPVIRYASPSIPTIFWTDVFILSPNTPPLPVVQGQFACPPLESPMDHVLRGF